MLKRLLKDVAAPGNKNMSLKTFKKVSKDKHFQIETSRMWHRKTTAMLAVTGALEIISKGANKYVDRIPCTPKRWKLKNSYLRVLLTSCVDFSPCSDHDYIFL